MGVRLTLGPGEHVDCGNDIHVVHASAHGGVQILSLQESAADSSGPEVHILFDRVWHFFVSHNVGQV